MRFCDLDEIKVCVDRQYENCHGYSGSKKAIYREAILAVKSILHSVKPIDAVEVTRCRDCKYHKDTLVIGFEHCCLYDLTMRYNDFCSYGKREGGSDND